MGTGAPPASARPGLSTGLLPFLLPLAWLLLFLAGATALVRWDIAQRRAQFQADARTAHRLLSQRAVQHEAVLATLALLQPGADPATMPEARLPAVYPQVLAVLRRDAGRPWPDAALQAAEQQSFQARRPALGPVDDESGRFTLVLASAPASFALRIDLQRMLPWDDWPIARGGPVRVALAHPGGTLELQPGPPASARPAGLTAGFVFAQPLSVASQPFELQLQQATGPAEWPWGALAAWALTSALAGAALAARQRGRQGQRRAEELLRLGQVARLNALGELAAGMAHELNQPLAALLANTQAAGRLLADDPPALDPARQAMARAAGQARRAADVVARLRRLVQAPDSAPQRQAVDLAATTRHLLDLMGPALQQQGIAVRWQGPGATALADPVALEQIVHNLLGNALQALAEAPAGDRRLLLTVRPEAGQAILSVADSGPGIAAELLPRLFEPFVSGRRGGLGLGLSLSRSLAQAMDGNLTAQPATPHGAEFRLTLPLAGLADTAA